MNQKIVKAGQQKSVRFPENQKSKNCEKVSNKDSTELSNSICKTWKDSKSSMYRKPRLQEWVESKSQ